MNLLTYIKSQPLGYQRQISDVLGLSISHVQTILSKLRKGVPIGYHEKKLLVYAINKIDQLDYKVTDFE